MEIQLSENTTASSRNATTVASHLHVGDCESLRLNRYEHFARSASERKKEGEEGGRGKGAKEGEKERLPVSSNM